MSCISRVRFWLATLYFWLTIYYLIICYVERYVFRAKKRQESRHWLSCLDFTLIYRVITCFAVAGLRAVAAFQTVIVPGVSMIDTIDPLAAVM